MKVITSVFFALFSTIGLTQNTLTDSATGCSFLMPFNCEVCTFQWTGDCVDGFVSGNGKLSVFHESHEIMTYEGEMSKGLFNGSGTYSDERNKLTGYFKDGMFLNISDTLYNNLDINTIDLVDSTDIYVSDGSSQELFYYVIKPESSVKGVLMILPSAWEPVESVLMYNTKLITRAHQKDLLVVIPSVNYNLYLDDFTYGFLKTVFSDISQTYKAPLDKVVMGGFSLGGMNSIRYTEMAYSEVDTTMVKPVAVYGIDPPLDYARLYRSMERTVEKNFSDPAVREATDFIKRMDQMFGGGPDEAKNMYVKHSSFSRSEQDGGNAKHLISVPIRIYCDPDVEWQLSNRRMDLYDMNASDISAMINYLLLAGNTEAEFVNALGKGYRMDGSRHPHSWSLAEPEACIDWVLEKLDLK